MKQNVLILQKQAPGDVVVLTAAIRDLVRQHSDKFFVNVRTTAMAIWDNNPYLNREIDNKSADITFKANYDLVNHINGKPWHFVHGFRREMEQRLGVQIEAGPFKGDIHMHEIEVRALMPQIQEMTGEDLRYWLIAPGVKVDYTNKAWEFARYQELVDRLAGRVLFVQVGERGHGHPGLRGVIDMRGKTDMRQLIRMVYHSSGVITGVSLLMHLAAAVPTRDGRVLKARPAVVIAGGREPPQWEEYPWHQYLDRCGMLSCCDIGGCWKSRVQPLPVEVKHNESLCMKPVTSTSGQVVPKCMDMITVDDVERAVVLYAEGYEEEGLSFRNEGFVLQEFLAANPCYDAGENRQDINSCSWIDGVYPNLERV